MAAAAAAETYCSARVHCQNMQRLLRKSNGKTAQKWSAYTPMGVICVATCIEQYAATNNVSDWQQQQQMQQHRLPALLAVDVVGDRASGISARTKVTFLSSSRCNCARQWHVAAERR